MPTLTELGLDRLSTTERLAVAEALWDSVADELTETILLPSQKAELERRLEDSNARPEDVTPWELIKARAIARSQS